MLYAEITNWDELELLMNKAKEMDVPISDNDGYLNENIFSQFEFKYVFYQS